MILAVGYRVRSHRGTQFRQWATARLSEFLVKGFAMDDERLKNPPADDAKAKAEMEYDKYKRWTLGRAASTMISRRRRNR